MGRAGEIRILGPKGFAKGRGYQKEKQPAVTDRIRPLRALRLCGRVFALALRLPKRVSRKGAKHAKESETRSRDLDENPASLNAPTLGVLHGLHQPRQRFLRVAVQHARHRLVEQRILE